ncbi:UDP-N-acetylmuramoyl-L-alanyl-D-glutamate--2,6-diaminopimelate ligase [Corynebacterium anserum]|uniref:UDP-N-acetylmuramoyl-L-alanyl-D-glutamate--2,6-diaminopimelate ligase n=1 Tax=Corynebacterium anserum TaxID=2684406 RepID=A0A7G7YMY1_9CORY|nr:UDP-N-acetylmuramoyl-L-alanyl-D-glutamate--2,6-diaminopimelate ligase [Corynebacterium anserum]QNH95851.1 UDP-N-acetylmuramoyl-L-alanyl-D-glutamate--2,6-diaminopimelate ligase [Corynebacterium anserum]
MTTLTRLVEITDGEIRRGSGASTEDVADLRVTSATLDSSQVQAGGLFCGVPGTRTHGAAFAAESGAVAVMTDAAGADIVAEQDPDLPVLVVDDVRRWMGDVAAEIYGHPSDQLKIIGITGTSGKTTTSYLVAKALMGAHSVGIIGTTGTRINGQPVPTKLTTPEAPTMQALLARMVHEGVTHVVMEVSSHALALGRVRGINFDVAAFTNLSQDHLDFHPTMDDYFATKATLFSHTYGNPSPVICVDDAWGQRLAHMVQRPDMCTVATSSDAANPLLSLPGTHWLVRKVEVRSTGEQRIYVTRSGEACSAASSDVDYQISLAGSFNVANSLLALGCVEALGEPECLGCIEDVARSIQDVQVPGRMQSVNAGQDFLALVDYAHKPGAVAGVVGTLRDYMPDPAGRIAMVLGAGGNRDRDKRPKMGYEAARVADAVFVTDDNPRDEDPSHIRAMVREGADKAASERMGSEVLVEEVADRAEAIQRAVEWAKPGDAVVVAGKGHEKGQLIAGVMHDFDDVEVLKASLRSKVAESSGLRSDDRES